MTRVARITGICLLLSCGIGAVQAAVTAHVDHVVVAEGEGVSLVIEGGSDQEPDLQPLQKDFDVQGTSNSKQIQFINGQMSSRSSWTVQLMPKHDGRLVIPALTVGGEQTAPINIEVTKAGSGVSHSDIDDLFLEVDAIPREVYVREQVVLTVRFYQAIDIREGSLTKPELDNAVVEKLGEDKVSEEMRDGVRFRVVQRKFAIFPQASGKLTIPEVVFDGQMVVANRSRRSFGGFDPFDRFLQQTRPVRLRSDSIDIQVSPQPAGATTDWWLPVQKLALRESWAPEPPVFKVGEPVTRTLRLEALGTLDSQLPDIKIADNANIKVYPDQPVTKLDGNGETMSASKEFKMAMIPTNAGTYTLPEIRIPWWNTLQQRMEVARIPAREVTVVGGVPASEPAAAPVVPAAGVASTQDNIVVPDTTATGTVASPGWWISMASVVLWLATLSAWWWDRRRYRAVAFAVTTGQEQVKNDKRLSQLSKEFEKACDAGVPRQAELSMVRLVRQVSGDPRIKNLGQILPLFDDAQVIATLKNLEQSLYGDGSGDWDGATCKTTMLPALRLLSQRVADDQQRRHANGLPDLYTAGAQ